jgi:hypothetical protein
MNSKRIKLAIAVGVVALVAVSFLLKKRHSSSPMAMIAAHPYPGQPMNFAHPGPGGNPMFVTHPMHGGNPMFVRPGSTSMLTHGGPSGTIGNNPMSVPPGTMTRVAPASVPGTTPGK